MKKNEKFILISILISVLILLFFPLIAQDNNTVRLSFDYIRQTGRASNQYALWVEDEKGNLIAPLFVTSFTGNGGWKTRSDSLPLWVEKIGKHASSDAVSGASSSNASSASGTIDAMSGSTPSTGALSYAWDLKDIHGKRLTSGVYTIVLEASLRWDYRVVYTGKINLKNGKTEVSQPQYFGEKTEDSTMIKNVKLEY